MPPKVHYRICSAEYNEMLRSLPMCVQMIIYFDSLIYTVLFYLLCYRKSNVDERPNKLSFNKENPTKRKANSGKVDVSEFGSGLQFKRKKKREEAEV